jgi:hypothetical protein
MTVTVLQVLDANATLGKFADAKVSYSTARKIARVIKALEDEVKAFDEKRNEIKTRLDELGLSESELQSKFMLEIQDILMSEVELPEFTKLKDSDLDALEITVRELIPIEWLIEE